jgi:long-chain fatty acid transport protein
VGSLLFGASLLAGHAYGSGFQVTENSAAGIGLSHADGAAANDPSTIASNPAGMSSLLNTQISGTLVGIYATTKFTDTGSTNIVGGQATGGNGGNPGGFVPLAAGFATHQLNDRVTVGIGLYAPYGLPTHYDDDWVGRYQAIKTDLKTINLNPVISVKLTDSLSIGGGPIVNYATANFSSAIGLGIDPSSLASSLLPCNLGFQSICTIVNNVLAPVGSLLPSTDGKVTVKMDSIGYGYNLGALLRLGDTARLGVAYHSNIKQDLKGTAHIQYGALGLDTTRPVSAELNLPEVASLSYYQDVNRDFSLMADVSWTRWSRFNELRIKFDDPNLNDVVVPQNWRNTTRVALGGEYRYGDSQTFRVGAALDPSPVTDATRNPRIPDADRVWASIGYGYAYSKNTQFDIGLAHLFVKDGTISDNRSAITGGTLNGTYTNSSATILGVSVRQTL